VKRIEDMLIKSGKFGLPSRRKLWQETAEIEVIAIDVKVEAQVNFVFVDGIDNIVGSQKRVTTSIVSTVDNTVDKKSDGLLSGTFT
jgi:hypothetical protein